MTILVVVQKGRVLKTAPIAKKFIDQPVENLENWMRKQKGFRSSRLD